jgi:hypothetical protein
MGKPRKSGLFTKYKKQISKHRKRDLRRPIRKYIDDVKNSK